jgi:hypothetical protein
MRNSSGGCLTAFVAAFSRIALLIFYFSRPVAFNATFPGGFLLPCLGFLFLPFTTMVYAWLMQPPGVGSIQGLDWLWLGLAVFSDLATIASAGYANRNRIPGATTPSPVTTTPPATTPAPTTTPAATTPAATTPAATKPPTTPPPSSTSGSK